LHPLGWTEVLAQQVPVAEKLAKAPGAVEMLYEIKALNDPEFAGFKHE
jgi:hypothetical protein